MVPERPHSNDRDSRRNHQMADSSSAGPELGSGPPPLF